ncbi:D-amino-acid transaminase [Litchfieldia alkalitelluris]|uniref:D-amino-acid transaminase n=1 Tax=Litchfieldia alkalitelluris TaxID=304268 RepID=UPI0009985BC2|nr:D-amino-acid transaminase [Litchfieldia alkalitelluris]
MEIAYYNGEFINIDTKVIPIQERGHQFGDGVYEVIRVYNGELFLAEEHLARLQKSADAIQLKLPLEITDLLELMKEGIKRSTIKEVEVYIQITRGIAPRTHYFPDVVPQLAMTVKPARQTNVEKREKGISVVLTEDERWANCYIKSLNLLPNVLAKQNAVINGFDEAIFVKDSFITEGSSSNIFVVKDGIVYTPPATKKILHGITRATVFTLAQENNLQVIEKEFNEQFLLDADEAFITSTSLEVQPIAIVNQHTLPLRKPITRLLQEQFTKLYQK